MFGFVFGNPRREEQLTNNLTQFNILMIGELGKIHRRLEVLEADLAARQAKEVAADKAEREKLYHGIG
jgi:hypothetical protein